MTRTQFPVVAGYALTVNKAQGLTIKEGIVVHLKGSRRFRPASKHGLPFVACTRSESFHMTALRNLPPWDDFVAGWDSDMLRMRLAFTHNMESMHERTMAKWGPSQPSVMEHRRPAKRCKAQGVAMPCPSCSVWRESV